MSQSSKFHVYFSHVARSYLDFFSWGGVLSNALFSLKWFLKRIWEKKIRKYDKAQILNDIWVQASLPKLALWKLFSVSLKEQEKVWCLAFTHITDEINPLNYLTGWPNRYNKLRRLLRYWNYYFKSRMPHVIKLSEGKISQKFEPAVKWGNTSWRFVLLF